MPEQNANYADMAEAFYDLPPVASIRIFRDLGLRYILRFQAQLQADEEACRNALSAASAAQTPQSGLATSDDIDVYHSQQRLIADTEKRLDKYYTFVAHFLQVSSLASLEPLDIDNLGILLKKQGHEHTAEGAPWKNEADLRSVFRNLAGTRDRFTNSMVELSRRLQKSSIFKKAVKIWPTMFNCVGLRVHDTVTADGTPSLIIDPRKLLTLLSIFVVTISSSISVLSMFVLNIMPSTSGRLGVIWAFLMLFSAATWWLGSADPLMLFMTSATYCAVLVVFIGSVQT